MLITIDRFFSFLFKEAIDHSFLLGRAWKLEFQKSNNVTF